MKCSWIKALLIAAIGCALGQSALTAQAGLTHRYSFTTDATDSVGTAHGTLQGTATAGAGVLNFNNPLFPGNANTNGYLTLPVSILPTSGSVTIQQWFQFGGSGFYTSAYTFRNVPADPGGTFGQYLMHTVSNPQGGPVPAGGGSSVVQTLTGYGSGESRAFGTTPGIGAGGGGYLDDGGAYMAATVIDGTAGTMSYYLYRLSDGAGAGLQSSIPAIPLSSYAFTEAFLGRSAFDGDGKMNGTVDEFRIYNHAKSANEIAADFARGPGVVPEPASVGLAGVAIIGLLTAARRRVR